MAIQMNTMAESKSPRSLVLTANALEGDFGRVRTTQGPGAQTMVPQGVVQQGMVPQGAGPQGAGPTIASNVPGLAPLHKLVMEASYRWLTNQEVYDVLRSPSAFGMSI